ncbi:MAG: DUF2461 domain-containing protein [bacterium]|nr:DUF2461 domain-containing protein [Chitinophagaceae bacterium]
MINSETLKFLKTLEKNNNKEWFDQNRKTYEQAKSNYLDFVGEVLGRMKKIDTSLADLEPKQCVFRINRDVRFSKNKSPYKTNMGASFSKGGKKVQCAGYYFHLEPGASFIGGGFWMPMAPELNKIRQEIDYGLEEFNTILNKKKFKTSFGSLSESEKLTRPPKGYEAENPAIELLKLKSFIVMKEVKDAELTGKELANKIVDHFETMMPLVDFLNMAID